MLERRRQSRAREFAAGTIAYRPPGMGRPRASMDCVVRDASEGGAMLLVDEPRRAPVEMELATRAGVRPARVVWRGETAVGVAFLCAAPSALPLAALPSAAPRPAPATAATVVDLDEVRRRKTAGSDEARLAARIARFVRPSRRPDPA